MRALLVEDDQGVADALVVALREQGWAVRHVTTGAEAVEALEGVDLVLLDMGLPDHDGLWVCARIRETSDVPVLALTARRSESSVVGALRAGVDDYVTKPYSLSVLLARVEAVLRRSGRTAPAPPDEAVPGLRLDRDARELVASTGETIALTAKECDLLVALARSVGRPVTRSALMEEVWDTTWVGASRTLDVHVASLRAKLGDHARISAVRGVGYRLLPPDDPAGGPASGPA